MKCVFEDEGFAVFDDVLCRERFLALQIYLQFDNYESIHQQRWAKSWRLTDGGPLVGTGYVSRNFPGAPNVRVLPAGTAIDFIGEMILNQRGVISKWISEDGWDYFTLSPYIYPTGTGLGWHEDDASLAGAYIYYAHPEWKPSWGGELCVMNYVEPNSGLTDIDSHEAEDLYRLAGVTGGCVGPEFGYTKRELRIMEYGVGRIIMPKPNRLVVLKSGYSHSVKKVDMAAGENVRCSITGFFVKGDTQKAKVLMS